MSDRLNKLLNKVKSETLPEINKIKLELRLSDNDRRLIALLQIRQLIEVNGLENVYFDLVTEHIHDFDNDCRWQSLIIIGKFLKTRHEDVWDIILKYGSSDDQDLRTAISTILLEHFFEYNPDCFNNKFEILSKEIKNGNKNLYDTLSICFSKFGNENNYKKVKKLLMIKK